jgi:hypothetical protein
VRFNITNSNFTNCSADNGENGGYGGALYTTSTVAGQRYLTNLIFSNNIA